MLCFCTNAHVFLQVLEGGRDAVSALYNRIAQDPRHRDVALLSYEEIGERELLELVDGPGQHEPAEPGAGAQVLESAVLDPYAVSGKASLALFNELVATASIGVQV